MSKITETIKAAKKAKELAIKMKEKAKNLTKKNVDSKGNTTSPLRSQSVNQAKTQKITEKQRRYKVGELKGAAKATAVITGGALLTKAIMKDDPKIVGTAANAKDKGNKTFTYKGKKYKTPTSVPPMPKPRPKKSKVENKKKMYMKEGKTKKDSKVEFAVGKAKKD
tara:strand:+ start:352 stop:849 length:498 start_codon:yes stop_codon:yes gene_type:complete